MKDRVREHHPTRSVDGASRQVVRGAAGVPAGLEGTTSGSRRHPEVFADLDEWIRHRLRAVQLKQWKRARPSSASCVPAGCRRSTRPRESRPTRRRWWQQLGDGPPHRAAQRATSTSWGCPGSPRDLNPPNRRMRTRMSGGVGGVVEALLARPYAD